ncbi:biotin transporter BioY [Candidatus Woesearchaeota archaeon]|nr:biotin transporter BioY [Candidatus Woesearchaeota archaeon]
MAKKTTRKSGKKTIKSDKKSESIAETKNIEKANNLKPLVFAALFAALTAAVSPLKIPLGFTPVPITLQTLVVLMSGAMLGPIYGALAMILYVVVGTLGLPVFAGGGSGIGAVLGPTGGYLISYFIAAFAIGKTLQLRKRPKYLDYVVAMIIGTIIIYVLGAGWALVVVPNLTFLTVMVGWVLPFIIGDTIKLLIAAYIAKTANIKRYLK